MGVLYDARNITVGAGATSTSVFLVPQGRTLLAASIAPDGITNPLGASVFIGRGQAFMTLASGTVTAGSVEPPDVVSWVGEMPSGTEDAYLKIWVRNDSAVNEGVLVELCWEEP